MLNDFNGEKLVKMNMIDGEDKVCIWCTVLLEF